MSGVSHALAYGQRLLPHPRLPRPRLGESSQRQGLAHLLMVRLAHHERGWLPRRPHCLCEERRRSDEAIRGGGEARCRGVSHAQANGQRLLPLPRLPRPRLGRVLAMTGASGRARRAARTVFARSDGGATKQSGEAGRSVRCGECPTRRPTGNASSPAPDCHAFA